MTFGQRIRELRQKAGLTQYALAKRADIEQTYLSMIENDQRQAPGEKIILKLASVFASTGNQSKSTILDDELLLLAGKFPSELIKQIGQNPQAMPYLRSFLSHIGNKPPMGKEHMIIKH